MSAVEGFMRNVDFGGDLPVVQGNRCGSLDLPVLVVARLLTPHHLVRALLVLHPWTGA